MVRIAVRTLTLNIFKVKYELMNKLVLNKSEQYFVQLSHFIANQIIDMDNFARSAQNEPFNRERLLNMIDIHVDNMHYINDILLIKNFELNFLLTKTLFSYIFGSLYFSSLADLRSSSTVLLCKVSSLFLLSHFFMIIHDEQLVQLVLSCLLFGDQNDISSEWIRNSENGLFLTQNSSKSSKERFFFYNYIRILTDVNDDHACFYALMLFYCILKNKGITIEMLEASRIPCENKSNKCDKIFIQSLIKFIETCSEQETVLRPITLELCCIILRMLIKSIDVDYKPFHNIIKKTVCHSLSKLISALRSVIFLENDFLEMFEEEYYFLSQYGNLKFNTILEDPSIYLPPSNNFESGVKLFQRLPYDRKEYIRRTLQFYFILRKFKLDLINEVENILPLTSKHQSLAEINDCINLNNCDLLSCIVIINSVKNSFFLVTDQFQLILVEPDYKKIGWAIVRFVGLLQNTQCLGDSEDNRVLHVIVKDTKAKNSSLKDSFKTSLDAKFIFDDHIRCMAAKQRLNKGKKISRYFKLNLICNLFEMSQSSFTSERKCELNSSSSSFSNQKDNLISIEKSNININRKLNLSVSDRLVPGSVQKLSDSEIKNLSLIDSSKN